VSSGREAPASGQHVEDAPVRAFAEFPTSLISDAMDELGVAAVLPDVRAQRVGQGRISGRAMTVRFERKSRDESAYRFGGGVGRPLEQVLNTMSRGDVVVMDLDGTRTASAWGSLASRIAQLKGVRGTVLWGTCRDVEEIRAVGYPVWAVGAYPRRSRNEFTFGSIQEPIIIGDVTIGTGDIVVADETGVVCVPSGLAEEALALVKKISGDEDQVLAQIEAGEGIDWDKV
jgi:4-hydroxy-4-methyl-2-oxoglutarate aldolase